MSGQPRKLGKQNFCFAPGCRTGYAGAPKASLFCAPRDAELRKQWESNLRRVDRPLTARSSVCERHFEPRFILRDYVHVINGDEVRMPRGKPSLVPGAVPTLLPDFPGNLSKKLSKPRPTTLTESPPTKKPKRTYDETTNPRSSPGRRFLAESTSQNARSSHPFVVHLKTYDRKQSVVEKCEEEAVSCDSVDTASDSSKIVEDSPLTLEYLKTNLGLPSQEWCLIDTPETISVVYATSVIKKHGDRMEISHPKCVSFSTVDDGPKVVVLAEAFFDGDLCCRAIVSSLEEAEAIVQDAHTTHICKGAMSASEFAEVSKVISTRCKEKMGTNEEEDTIFSLQCARNVAAEGAVCTPCRALRKLLLNRKSRVRTLAVKKNTRNQEPDESPQKRESVVQKESLQKSESTEHVEVKEVKTSQLQQSLEQLAVEQLVSLHALVGSEHFVEVREDESLHVEESPEQIVALEVEVPPEPEKNQQSSENLRTEEGQQERTEQEECSQHPKGSQQSESQQESEEQEKRPPDPQESQQLSESLQESKGRGKHPPYLQKSEHSESLRTQESQQESKEQDKCQKLERSPQCVSTKSNSPS